MTDADDIREWSDRHPVIHVRLDGDEKALREALKAAGVERFEIIHYTPLGWQKHLDGLDALAPGAAAAARIGIDLANRTIGYAFQNAGEGVPGLMETLSVGDNPRGSLGPAWLSKVVNGIAGTRPGMPKTKRRRLTDAFLQKVAEVYRANISYAPTEAVGAAFGVKSRMASTYVARARERGFLPPTTPGKKAA
ncbi:uncharacterized protein RMCC_2446 [Mycolicibacterium canariasense]|uniref:Uncharacterized protein n=1 Tax=Mycolicibacterium canariasense TaxID=228230 RepID=A0A124E226_MYCCR|nr:hypothetical protein [Mycolicibacterium canariasense]MCV7212648.1 hypothetical protein [Mycolicibacterium canariasense]ORV02515.1 hypothetical protein AWB94_00825 [Mycolicibacterium canariasense]GAS95480.1 uncharacterized protein RMCC_2446 [Mycolicibacterium canariasense]